MFHGTRPATAEIKRTSAMKEYSEAENLQKQHYGPLTSKYAAHYGDKWSQRYRLKFIDRPMLGDVDLCGMEVLDAMCGSGETTEYLLHRGAHVTGIDISKEAILAFQQRFPDCKSHCGSILSTGFPSDSFDCVVVVGGLHHLHPHCSLAIDEIHRVLKTGGLFCFYEPHSGSLPNLARQFWYRRDRLFAANEAAIDVRVLKQSFFREFEFLKEDHGGSVAYLLVLNSMAFRVPLWMKRFYSEGLMWVESAVKGMLGKRLSCTVICRWKKRALPTSGELAPSGKAG